MLQYGSACGGLLTYFGSLKRQVGLVSSIIIEIVINPRGQSSETARKHEFGDFSAERLAPVKKESSVRYSVKI